MENQKQQSQMVWAVAVFSLLWNLMGVASFFNKLLTDEALKCLLAEQELYSSYPLWTFIAFGGYW
jgi:hypothetical protein